MAITIAEIRWKLYSQSAITEESEIKWTVLSNEDNITTTTYECEKDAIEAEFIKRCTGFETKIYSPEYVQEQVNSLIKQRQEYEARFQATGGGNRVSLTKVLDNEVIVCGHCGYDYTHLNKVEIFDRQEDATTGKHITCTLGNGQGTLVTDNDLTENPSPRRTGVRLTYNCEDCGQNTHITFSQHKGITHTGIL